MQSIAETILRKVGTLRRNRPRVLVAIDGRSAAGKTSLAALLRESCGCNVIHMDEFFLRPEQRTTQRLAQPGENVDHERFADEVLIPLARGEQFSYRPYDCKTQAFGPPIRVTPHPVTVVEGAYSCHPKLADSYDLTIFLSTDPQEQARRILKRNGEIGAAAFADCAKRTRRASSS